MSNDYHYVQDGSKLMRRVGTIPLHHFEDEKGAKLDLMLRAAIKQGYVPQACLLGGIVVMDEVSAGRDPCAGCNGPREKCGGRPRSLA